jgi:hypothetical protein
MGEMQIITELFRDRTSSIQRKLEVDIWATFLYKFLRSPWRKSASYAYRNKSESIGGGVQLLPIGIPIVCWNTSPSKCIKLSNKQKILTSELLYYLNNNILSTKHKKDHDICHWKSRSLLGTFTSVGLNRLIGS